MRAWALVSLLLLLLAAGGRAAADCPPPLQAPTPAQLHDANSRDRGLLWAIERDGRRSWLYGTLHVGRPEWAAPGPKVAAALAASGVVALEIDPSDAAVGSALRTASTAAATPVLAPPLQARLARQLAAACLAAEPLAGMHPALQAMVLALVQARRVGLDPAFGQEQLLARAARAAGKPVVALETVALQKQALLPDDAAATAHSVEQTLAQVESGEGARTIERLARAWDRGDLAQLEGLAGGCDRCGGAAAGCDVCGGAAAGCDVCGGAAAGCDVCGGAAATCAACAGDATPCASCAADAAALQALNDARNPALADGIAALHARGAPVFAAVGALHMTGPLALPRLLAARGFSVERVPFAP